MVNCNTAYFIYPYIDVNETTNMNNSKHHKQNHLNLSRSINPCQEGRLKIHKKYISQLQGIISLIIIISSIFHFSQYFIDHLPDLLCKPNHFFFLLSFVELNGSFSFCLSWANINNEYQKVYSTVGMRCIPSRQEVSRRYV